MQALCSGAAVQRGRLGRRARQASVRLWRREAGIAIGADVEAVDDKRREGRGTADAGNAGATECCRYSNEGTTDITRRATVE